MTSVPDKVMVVPITPSYKLEKERVFKMVVERDAKAGCMQ